METFLLVITALFPQGYMTWSLLGLDVVNSSMWSLPFDEFGGRGLVVTIFFMFC
jgi:hypothetical protein